jgi:hypothetical protein
MTDRNKFEAMLEALINEDHEAAKDIFHNIVVGKSREIYEKLLAEEFPNDEEGDDEFGADDEEGEDEFGADDEEGEDEFGADDEEGDDEFGDDDEEGDDEFGADDEFGDEADGNLEDRVMDLEDALDELKSEFEQLLAGEEDEPEHDDMFGGDDDMMAGDDDMFGGDEVVGEEDEFQSMFEYVNKVALPTHGDNGKNPRSLFNKPKYNDMGGVAPKFGGTAKGEGTQGGLLNPKTQDLTAGLGKLQNRPDSKAGKTGFKKQEPGHGAEKKGNRESAPNTKSLIPGRK